ncbi:MAG TPA: cytochrome d ubiquinol oxidase subunit II [Rhodocyclaceae bacterium]|nr:cytochrome d ubiquinol oxidase subunit II [Rhodocyclaceae bacterium]
MRAPFQRRAVKRPGVTRPGGRHIVPPDITIWEAAAPDASLLFLLVGAVVLVPMILGYTAYAYWVIRGKIRPGEGYH